MELKLCEIRFTVKGTDEKRMSFDTHTLDDSNYVFHKNLDVKGDLESQVLPLFSGAGKVYGLTITRMPEPLLTIPGTIYLKQSENPLAEKLTDGV